MGVRRRVTRWYRVRRLVLAVLFLGTVTVSVLPSRVLQTTDAEAVGTAPRLMLVGDSITQGSSGDLTWRWFLSRHLARTAPGVRLVGPSTVVVRDKWNTRQAGQVADANFQQAHAAQWGDSFSRPLAPRFQQLARERPDIVVLALGTNDVRRGLSGRATLDLAEQWVQRARTLLPGVDVVLTQAPVTSVPELRVYNAGLVTLGSRLDSDEERVVVATAAAGYRMGAPLTRTQESTAGFTWDEWHPNSAGQQRISAAVADALAELGVGAPVARPLPRATETATAFGPVSTRARPRSVVVRWQRPLGSTSVDLYVKQRRGKGPRPVQRGWKRLGKQVTGNRWIVRGVHPCTPVRVKLRPRKGWTLADPAYSSRVVSLPARAQCARLTERR